MSYLQLNMADNSLMEPKAVNASSVQGYASESDWNRVRPLIKRFYVDEDKTLKELMAIMSRDHGHRATVKMYKNRITKWGLDKKTKESEAWALLKLKKQRDAVGKNSVFRVRGKNVTIEDVQRYFKRKGISNPDVEAQHPEPPMPEAIECWTPLSSPRPAFTSIQTSGDENFQMEAKLLKFQCTTINAGSGTTTALHFTQGDDDIHEYLNVHHTGQKLPFSAGLQSSAIPHSPLPPRNLLVSEKLFASIKAYYTGAFESGLFKSNDKGYLFNKYAAKEENKLDEFGKLCNIGFHFMGSKLFVEGRQCFSRASGLVSNLLRIQHPSTFRSILFFLIEMCYHGYRDVATIFRNLARELASINFAEEHPWRQMFSWLCYLDDSLFELALPDALRCIWDTFANFLGHFHRETIGCYMSLQYVAHSDDDTELFNLF